VAHSLANDNGPAALSRLAARTSHVPRAWGRLARRKSGLLGTGFVLLFVAVAAAGPAVAPHNPYAPIAQPFLHPGTAHPFGSDNLGRDVLSRVIYGTRVSLVVGLAAVLTSTSIGILLGSISGYYGGAADAVLMRLTEFFQVLPRFFLALVIVAITGPGIGKIVFVIAILSWPPMARLVRGQFTSLGRLEFVEAARALGYPTARIIFRQILPNALPPAVVLGSLDVAQAILLEAGLSFFGLGDPNLISWGMLLNIAQGFLQTAWWMGVFPGLAIFFVVLGFNLFGDFLNDMMNPRFAL